MAVSAGIGAGHKKRMHAIAARNAASAIQRHFQRDHRPAFGHAHDMATRQPAGGRRSDTTYHLETGGSQTVNAAAPNARVWIFDRDDRAGQSSSDDRVGAWACLSVMRARLQGDVDGRAFGARAGHCNRLGFGMGTAAARSCSARNKLTRFRHCDHCSDRRIWRGCTDGALRYTQRDCHHVLVKFAALGRHRYLLHAPQRCTGFRSEGYSPLFGFVHIIIRICVISEGVAA
jgi:hypothetical protein